MTQAYIDELGEQLSLSEAGDSGTETVVYFVCGDVLAWNVPRWTNSVQTAPELNMYFHELPGSAAVYVASTGLTGMWLPGGACRPRTHTDDGCINLKSEVLPFLVDCIRSAHSYLFPSLPEETTDPPATEPHQEAIEWIKAVSGLSWDRIGKLVGVTRPAINAWRRGGPIRDDHRQRLFAVRDVLERAAKHNPRPSELTAWLDTPRGADAKTPAELLEAGKVGRARLLAITSSSPKVKAPSKWAQRYALEAYQESRERVRALPPEQDEELLAEMSDDE